MKKTGYAIVLFSFAIMTACGGTQYRKAGEDKGSREWGAREIKGTVNKMVSSLYSHLRDGNINTYIELKNIRNRTGEHIDTKLLGDEIMTNLIQMRIRFIDRTYTADALAEMERGMTGMINQESAVPTGGLVSPNFYLYGEIRENLQYPHGKEKQYIVVTLTLTSLSSGVVEWQDRQEFYKISSTTPISR